MPRPESGLYYIRVRATDADHRFIGAFNTPKFEVGYCWTTGTGEAPANPAAAKLLLV